MAKNWIKIDLGLLGNRKIKYIRKQKNGNSMVLTWLMLLNLAGECDEGGLVAFTDSINYTTETLAMVMEQDEEIVSNALNLFESLGMIEHNGEGVIKIKNWNKYQG